MLKRISDAWRQRSLSTALWRQAALCLPGAGCLALVFVLSWQTSSAVNLGHYYQHSCQTDSRGISAVGASSSLRLLLVTPALASDIATFLCGRDSVQQQFGAVEVSWRPRTELTASELMNEDFDVIWNREHFLSGLAPDLHSYYDTLLHYDNYAVFWISLHSEPVLTAEYFRGKRIGLLSDISSHTHHLLPLRSLKEAGSSPDEVIPVYFDDASTLYESFYRGEIDLMTGGLSFAADRPVYRTLLDNSATAATFFIRKELRDSRLRCDVIAALELLTPLWQGIKSHHPVNGDC